MSDASKGKPAKCPHCGADKKENVVWAGTWAREWECGSFQRNAGRRLLPIDGLHNASNGKVKSDNGWSHGFKHQAVGRSLVVLADCFEWLRTVPENSIHAIVTDPPYGVKEYDQDQLTKRANGSGGIWRIPPSFDGHVRSPLPRFTALNAKERERVRRFFADWGSLTVRVLRPGGHIVIATNAFIAQLLYGALVDSGLEFRGQVIRAVRTLRGGDRPKNAEDEFPGVSSMPKGCYEPWGLFRKPLPKKMTVGECLRRWETGALRRTQADKPFEDLIISERTPRRERELADHPSLKPQSFLRQIVHALLPLGTGTIVDPFMGSGSTIAAANAMDLNAVGVERMVDYFQLATKAIPLLSKIVHRHHQPTLI